MTSMYRFFDDFFLLEALFLGTFSEEFIYNFFG